MIGNNVGQCVPLPREVSVRKCFFDVALLIGLAIWLVAFVGGFHRFPDYLPHWVVNGCYSLGPAILLLMVARASPRRFVDIILISVFAIWVIGYLMGGMRRLVGEIPSWALGAWYNIGPVALTILVMRGWISQGDDDWPLLRQRGERALLVGFAVWCVIAGFLGTVMTGTIVLMLLGPVALGSTAAGVYQARDPTVTPYRQAIACALIILGFAALLWMGQETVQVAYRWAVASLPAPESACH